MTCSQRSRRFLACVCALVAATCMPVAAQTDTTFTYQGTLNDASSPANGDYSMRFLLYDALVGGHQIGSTVIIPTQAVTNGLFTTELDYGADALDNTGRWLAIVVNGTTLSPRQPISRAPYSIQTRGINVTDKGFVGIGRTDEVTSNEIFGIHRPGSLYGGMFASTDAGGRPFYGYDNDNETAWHYLDGATGDWKLFVDGERMTVTDEGNVGIGTTTPTSMLHTVTSGGTAIFGHNTTPTGFTYGVRGQSESTSARGVYGYASATSGVTYGVRGQSRSESGRGVYGYASATSGMTYGVRGESDSTGGHGLHGMASASSGLTSGVYGRSDSTSGIGLEGYVPSSTGNTYGVRGSSQSTSGRGVHGEATASSGTTYGVRGTSLSTSGIGVDGWASAATGTTYGVRGVSNSPSGFDFYAAGAGTNYGASSSRRWKNNIVNIDNPLDKLASLRGVYFDWDTEHGGQHDVGMIAEEVGKVLPDIVNYEENGIDAIGMDYSKMTPLLVEAVNALRSEKNRQLAERDKTIEKMATQNERLEDRLAQLESIVAQLATHVGDDQ